MQIATPYLHLAYIADQGFRISLSKISGEKLQGEYF